MARRPPWLRRIAGLAAPLILIQLIQPGSALGQTPASSPPNGPLDRLDPAPAADAFFSIPSAGVAGRLRPGVALLWSFAKDPLVLRTAPASPEGATRELALVDRQMILHTLVSVELGQRLKLELDVPFTLDQGGTSGSIGALLPRASPSGASVNDLRAGARVVVLPQEGFLPAAAVAFSAWLPTGDERAFTGSESARFEPQVIVGATYARFLWSLSLGRRFQPPAPEAPLGSQTLVGAAVAVRWRALQVGPELSLAWDAHDADPAAPPGSLATLVKSTFSAEALLGARVALGAFTVGAGGGPGIGRAPGTPTYRLFAGVGYAIDLRRPEAKAEARPAPPLAEPPRTVTSISAGAGAAGDKPIAATLGIAPDRDGDTVPDAEDACPALVGDATPGAFRRGCPRDGDRDGVFDIDDRCPDEAGVPREDAAKNGCPADSDDDGIVDAKDACPSDKGKPTEDPKTNGCPASVRVEGEQIVILQQVNFETGRDEIRSTSFDLLGQVAAVLKEHPDIARVAVDGHTDDVGAAKANLNLSQRRAVAVVRWLSDHGIDARRLEARGFGPRRPVADNTSDAGRAKNRRVEFLIRRRSPEGEAGWREGPIE